ncbi:PucR family transcriptional regulator [Parafrigoribacterium mesophilum]
MPATVRRLLDHAELRLALLTPESALPAGSLEAIVPWVHSSDLPDPTPFLSAGMVLLTTGTQFGPDATEATVAPYVSRLREHDVTALGFGTDVVREGTPDALIGACQTYGLPLFEVPYRTPFIAIARLVADIAAADAAARNSWALAAQRAIALAALRSDGLSATLAELSRQLHHWVALFDAAGSIDRVFPRDALSGPALEEVSRQAALLLGRARRSSATVVAGGESITLQTLGGRGRLRGILAFGEVHGRDQASEQVVTSVVALAGLALEQNHTLDRVRGNLRTGMWRLLLAGDVALVDEISRETWGPLPAEPFVVVLADAPTDRLEQVIEYIELRAESARHGLFYAVTGDSIVFCADPAHPIFDDLTSKFSLPLGRSAPTAYADLHHALRQAELAHERALQSSGAAVDFHTVSGQGVLALMVGAAAAEVGRSVLEPLTAHDAAHGTDLVTAVRTWLEANGEFESASRTLGVHRHTLRARIALVEELLGQDLGAFRARADLWTALLAVESAREG